MTRAEALRMAHFSDSRIKAKFEKLERLQAIAEKSTAILTGMPRGSSEGSKLEKTVLEIIELEELLADDLAVEYQVYKINRETINGLSNNLGRTIFELRYMSYKTWQEIADEIGYERSYVERVHNKIMEEIEKDENT